MDVPKQFPKKLLALFLSFFLLAGCAAIRSNDPFTAEEHRQRAEELIFAKDYAGAADELALALRKAPGEGDLYLRLGEIREVLGQNEDARETYEEGMRKIEDVPPHKKLAYRLALLRISKLNQPEEARGLLGELPEGTVLRFDLQAAVAIAEGDGRAALKLLNQALRQEIPKPAAARILFHAAQAYNLLGDSENTSKYLYQAINLADELSTSKDIEIFWRGLHPNAAPAPAP